MRFPSTGVICSAFETSWSVAQISCAHLCPNPTYSHRQKHAPSLHKTEFAMTSISGTSIDTFRREKHVLVTHSHALGMLGVIRSLGRAGYQVHAASSERAGALGFSSRFTHYAAIHPPYESPKFLPWLDTYLESFNISAIIPSEGFLHAITSRYDRYRHLIPDAAPLEIVRSSMSKIAVQGKLLKRIPDCPHLPAGGIIGPDSPLPDLDLLSRWPGPFYVKGDAEYSTGERVAHVARCENAQSLLRELVHQQSRYSRLLWQAHAPGRKVGVSLWRHNGEFRAESMVLGIHTAPHTGGMMSLRRTFWHERMLADAKAKMAALEWPGVAMMEYKWDAETDDFWFIEMNARYWGYLHLDLYSGKDFPAYQLDAFFGHCVSDLGPAKRAVTCRNSMPGEVSYLLSLLRDRQVNPIRKLWESLEFTFLFFHPFHKADLLFPGDSRPYWIEWKRFLDAILRRPTSREVAK